MNLKKATKMNARMRKKADATRVKGKVEDVKEEGVARLFFANCNGLRKNRAIKGCEQAKKNRQIADQFI